jgi:hypothetical protein
MRGQESVQFSNIGAVTTAAFELRGGKYMLLTKSTGTGTIDLEMQAFDGVTYIPVATQVTATTSHQVLDLPPGQYEIVIGTFTANYITLTRIPND